MHFDRITKTAIIITILWSVYASFTATLLFGVHTHSNSNQTYKEWRLEQEKYHKSIKKNADQTTKEIISHNRVQTFQPEQKKDYDIYLQWRMATAADRGIAASWWQMGLGVCSMFFIALATYSSLIQASAASHSVKLQYDTLNKIERPYVYVEVLKPGIEIDKRGPDYPIKTQSHHFKYQCFNVGRTPANIISIYEKFVFLDKGEWPSVINIEEVEPRGIPTGIIAHEERTHSEKINMFPIILLQDREAINKQDQNVFWLGFVKFTDTAGNIYRTGFCFLFDGLANNFIMIGDKQYNYTKQEKTNLSVKGGLPSSNNSIPYR